jgi:hypothetical protein
MLRAIRHFMEIPIEEFEKYTSFKKNKKSLTGLSPDKARLNLGKY